MPAELCFSFSPLFFQMSMSVFQIRYLMSTAILLITVTLMLTVQIRKDPSTALVKQDILEMGCCVLVRGFLF